MLDSWIAEVVGRMHIAGISNRELAEKSGYAYTYVSEILHGKRGDDRTQKRILEALSALEQEAQEAESAKVAVKPAPEPEEP